MLREETNTYSVRRQQMEILKSARRIAVVGLRPDPIYKSYACTQKLIEYGLEIAPVIANCESILGLTRYGRVSDIAEAIDIVQFYTDGKAAMTQAARDAIAKEAKAFWVESAAASDEVRALLKNAGVCLVEYRRLAEEYEKYLSTRTETAVVSQIEPLRHVSERLTRYPVTVTPSASIESALVKMKKGHFRHLPVVDENNHLLGMFSDRDLRLMYPSPSFEPDEKALEKFAAAAMADVATFSPVSILPDATLENAADLMLRWNVEALPVIAGNDYLIGIITSSDFLKEFMAHREQSSMRH
jgi:CBS domain-containing protein/predicted CoA-binding protein